MDSKKILFIAHDSSRTGAPFWLLYFLRWVKEHTTLRFEILLKTPGPLEREFAAIAPTREWPHVQHDLTPESPLIRDVALIYSNTVANSDIVRTLSGIGCPVITHVHELDYAIRRICDGGYLRSNISSRYIAASKAVQKNLENTYEISADMIDMVYESLPIEAPSLEAQNSIRHRIRRHLGIPNDAFVVVANASVEWRKSPDIFIQAAYAVRQQRPKRPVHFVWMGAPFDHLYMKEIQYDITMLNLKDTVHFIGSRTNPLDYMIAADAFAMLSREEALSIAMLEAALFGKPVICFEKAGGPPEFVEHDAGYVVPYLDVRAVAEKVMTLAGDPALCAALGQRAKEKVHERHDINRTASQVVSVITKVLKNNA